MVQCNITVASTTGHAKVGLDTIVLDKLHMQTAGLNLLNCWIQMQQFPIGISAQTHFGQIKMLQVLAQSTQILTFYGSRQRRGDITLYNGTCYPNPNLYAAKMQLQSQLCHRAQSTQILTLTAAMNNTFWSSNKCYMPNPNIEINTIPNGLI